MKGCTNYTDEATRWGQGANRRVTPFRVFLVLLCGVAAVLIALTFLPQASDEGFTVAAAQEANAEVAEATAAPPQPSSSLDQVGQTENAMPLVIYLTGAVVQQGVYELEPGSRANKVVELAGGLTEDAAVNYVNLAAPLQDGQHIHIPSLSEIELGEAARIAASEASGAVAGVAGSAGTDVVAGSSTQDTQKININTADSAELESLPGIGAATARRIIDYREKNGVFKNIEDLKNVSGIGEKKYADLVDKVCI
jgi:competence protein ComEA